MSGIAHSNTRFIRDNHHRGRVADFLEEKISEGSTLSVVSAYFTIHAYGKLAKQLDKIDGIKFLFGEPSFITSLDPDKTEQKFFRIEDDQLDLVNRLQQKAIAYRCRNWLDRKAEIRSVCTANLLHGKLYHIENGHGRDAILGSSNFTLRGLGFGESSNIELNIVVDNEHVREELKSWFDELWQNEQLVIDVKDQVLRYLEQLYVDYAPEFIYFKTLFHVFEKFLSEQADGARLFQQTDIVDKKIWEALFDFQKDGAKGAINKINTHGGCILADSVGLGKTYTALAVIKYFELRNHRVLVLCPKKLRENWTTYQVHNNSSLNPFLDDKFTYTVLSHTDLSRDQGMAGKDTNLATLIWGNFDLVVIDESHNFRNNAPGKMGDDGELIRKSRYERLMEDIIKSGVDTKVMLLSATPVNNNLKDLRNQLYLVTKGEDDQFADSLGISSLKETLAVAQRNFTEWAKKEDHKDVKDLIEKLSAGFFTLLDELTIARSRRHLERYYSSSLEQIGGFPERIPPASVSPEIDLKGDFMSYDQLNDEITNYQLSIFNPTAYLLDKFKGQYEAKEIMNFSQDKREHFLIGMMKVNFLKRLESSVHSFNVTMRRTIEKIEDREKLIEDFLAHKAAKAKDIQQDELHDPDEEDEELVQAFEVGTKLKIPMEHLDVSRWLGDLKKDRKQLTLLADAAKKVTPERDAKLKALRELIEEKVRNPTTNTKGEQNRKVIVFCAFADTADYLYDNLLNLAKTLEVHIALVSGGAKPNQTTYGKSGYTQILTNFAPRAKNRDKMDFMPQDGEIDILIATDCISEGQNLQDCDLLVNYDIHWNPVRIIQRFGRIDRIGSLNESIRLVNFWPTQDLNKYINLKHRVEARMALVDLAATAEDNVLRSEELEELITADLRYRDKQLKRLKDEIIDLEDFNESVSLNEFTLDDFRMELAAYIESNRKALEKAPSGLYAVVPPEPGHAVIRPGVIFCLKQVAKAAGNEAVNPLQPYFLVYIRDDGEVRYNFTAPKHILEIFRSLCRGQDKAHKKLCELFDQRTSNGEDMARYTELLKGAVNAIFAHFKRKNASNLLSGRDGKLVNAKDQVKKSDDLELITWLVITDRDSSNAP